MRSHPALFTAVAALALSACEPGTDTIALAPAAADPADATVATEPPAPVPTDTDTQAETAQTQVRAFDCESGHRVELVAGDMARVTLADGRVIELPRKPDGVAEYRGEALTFDIDDDGRGGVLGQDEVGGFACAPAG